MNATRQLPILVTFLACFGLATPSAAAPITITYADGGWYQETGNHDPNQANYSAGRITNLEYRNFFTFDLSGLVGQTITSATLALYNPSFSGVTAGYLSPDPTETYALFDVVTPTAVLTAGGTGLVGIFADLGTGVSYGSQTVSLADNGALVLTTLNAAGISALNLGIGGTFGHRWGDYHHRGDQQSADLWIQRSVNPHP